MTIENLGVKLYSGLKSDRKSDSLGTSGNGTVYGATLDTTNEKLGSGCYSFDGTNDYVQAGTVSDFIFLHNGNPNTVTFWFKKDTPESGDVREIFGTADGTNDGMEVVYLDRSSASETRRVKIEFTNTSGQQVGLYYAQEFFPNDSDWHHYAIVSDLSNNYLKAYVDGVEKAADSSYPTFTGTPTSANQQHVLNIGRRNSGTFYLDGDLDDMSFWSRKLDPTSEISALYNSDTGALVSSLSNKAGLKAYYNMDTASASGQVLNEDFSGYADQAAADAAWVSQDTAKTRVNISTDKLDWAAVNDGTNDAVTHDLSSALSDTKWICRFKMTIDDADNSGLAPGQDRNQLAVGMFDKSSATAYNGTIEGIYLQLHLDRDGTDRTYFSRSTGGQLDQLNSRVGDFSTTTYYVEIKRTSDSNATMTMWTDGYDGSSALSSTPVTLTTCSGINDLQYFGVRNSHYNYGSNMDGTISEVMIYDDVTSVPSPQIINNASTTAPISSLTGVRTNSIFQQTDDTPTYWWYNGTSWLLDGTTKVISPESDYASTSGWTDVDTGGDIAIDTTNKGVTYTDVNVGDSGIGKSLGTTLSNSKWLCQFTFQIADWNTNDAGLVSLTNDHTQGFKVSGLKTINFMPQGTPLGAGSGSYNRFVLMSGQTNSYAEKASPNDKFVANTQYWVDMYRDGSNIKCKVYTNSGRTGTPHWESDNLPIGTNLDGLTGIQHWNENTADTDIGTGWVREITVYNGVTEKPE